MAKKAKKAAAKPKARAKKPAPKKSASAKSARSPAPKAASAPKAAPQPKWKPLGLHDVIANLVLRNAAGAIEFYKNAFGAREMRRAIAPDGRSVWHAELRIGDSTVFLNDEMQGGPGVTVAAGPEHKPTISMQLYVPDCDAVFNKAVQAGAKPAMPMMDMFWGDRAGLIVDPFGQTWMISTRVKNLSEEEMRKAGEEFAKQMARQSGMQRPQPASSTAPPRADSSG